MQFWCNVDALLMHFWIAKTTYQPVVFLFFSFFCMKSASRMMCILQNCINRPLQLHKNASNVHHQCIKIAAILHNRIKKCVFTTTLLQTCIRIASTVHQKCIKNASKFIQIASTMHQKCVNNASPFHQICIYKSFIRSWNLTKTLCSWQLPAMYHQFALWSVMHIVLWESIDH